MDHEAMAAKEGQRFVWRLGKKPHTVTVKPKCATTGDNGRWYCIHHPKADVYNNFMMHAHLDSGGTHSLVWVCGEHGPEVP